MRVEQAPAVAFEASRTAARAVRGVLREHGIGDSAGEGSRLSLKTATEYLGRQPQLAGYQCQAAFAVQCDEAADIRWSV